MRMSAEAGASGWPVTLCAMRYDRSSPDRTHIPPPPPSPRDHFSCPLCQSHAVPLAILAGAISIVIVGPRWTRWRWAIVTETVPSRPFRLYGSRAPPVLT
jgi:hypothetical protein